MSFVCCASLHDGHWSYWLLCVCSVWLYSVSALTGVLNVYSVTCSLCLLFWWSLCLIVWCSRCLLCLTFSLSALSEDLCVCSVWWSLCLLCLMISVSALSDDLCVCSVWWSLCLLCLMISVSALSDNLCVCSDYCFVSALPNILYVCDYLFVSSVKCFYILYSLTHILYTCPI